MFSAGCKKSCCCDTDQTPKEFPGIIQNCRLKSISQVGTGNMILIEYNDQGNPKQMFYTQTVTTTRKFEYDDKNRLIRYYIPRMDNLFFNRSHYYYENGSNNIAYDSTYLDGSVNPDGSISSIYVTVNNYTYDQYNRIIKITSKRGLRTGNSNWIRDTVNYSYDKRGNRESTASIYDDKVNYLRTNKIWMFLERDYSVNNQRKARSYTSDGLPERFFVDEPPGIYMEFSKMGIKNAIIAYDRR